MNKVGIGPLHIYHFIPLTCPVTFPATSELLLKFDKMMRTFILTS